MAAGGFHAVILAGGSGTRFWPLSRVRMPKQCLNIIGDQSMFTQTLTRAKELVRSDRIWIVTTRDQTAEIHRELLVLGLRDVKVLEEPVGRNTAPAIGLAAVKALLEDSRACLAVFPADHYISDQAAFVDLIKKGRRLADRGWLVTLGAEPTRPETGYGYIQKRAPLPPDEAGSVEAFEVERFTEKPNLDTASSYLSTGQFLWNCGIFLWKADRFMEEMQRHLPEHYRGLLKIQQIEQSAASFERIDELYGSLQSISVDYGILERANRVAVIPTNMGWNDIGSWRALREVLPQDEHGNVIQGDVMALGVRNSLMRSEDRLVAALGVENLVIVDTQDALLVCPEHCSQEVRKIAEQLRDRGRDEALIPRMVVKPWGAFKVLDTRAGYQVKWLDIKAGERLSLQSHQHRAEHWVVVSGTASVTVDGQVVEVPQGAHIHIPCGSSHRVQNRGENVLRLIEVQIGEYFGEDDIIRYQDDYGRSPRG